jgi:hypothetical protein
MAWEQDLINEIKGLREDIYNGVLNTNSGKGGGSIRRYSRVSPDDVESIDELLERYKHKETDIERFNKLKEIKVPFYGCVGNHDLRSMQHRTQVEQILEYNHSTFSFDRGREE